MTADSPETGDVLLLPPALHDLELERNTPPSLRVWRELVNRLTTLAVGDLSLPADPITDPWYREAVAGSPDPIFVIDLEGTVRTWNPACERVFGYGQGVVGATYRPFVTSPDEEALDALCDRVAAGESVTGVSLVYRSQDGGLKYTATRLYPLRSPGGTVTGCVVANTDVTAQLQAETQLAEQRAFYEHILHSVPPRGN